MIYHGFAFLYFILLETDTFAAIDIETLFPDIVFGDGDILPLSLDGTLPVHLSHRGLMGACVTTKISQINFNSDNTDPAIFSHRKFITDLSKRGRNLFTVSLILLAINISSTNITRLEYNEQDDDP